MDSAPTKRAKRPRRSRFAPAASAAEPQREAAAQPAAASPLADDPPPPIQAASKVSNAPAEAHRVFPNASVEQLRSRLAASRRPQPAPNPPKRRRTRFSAAPNAAISAPQKAPPRLDITAIPVAPVSTLRINRNAAQQRRVEQVLRVSEEDLIDTNPDSNPYFDAGLRAPQRGRLYDRRELNFVPQGQIVAKAELQRENAAVQLRTHEYRKQLAESGKEAAVLPVLPPLAEDLRAGGPADDVPECEWWDLPFRVNKAGKNFSSRGDGIVIEIREERITHYIHHPPPIPSAIPKRPSPVLPLMLTKKETKKLRRQRRMEAQKEKQEMVAVGLLPPPPPKVKLSNLMRVLASEATADPTKIEADVRAQVEERRRKHEADNAARKKSKEERREKAREKIERDKEDGLHAAVFRISNLRNPQHRFKIDVNARQLELSGTMVLFPDCNILVAEGGTKALRKYKKLLLRRIDWNQSLPSDSSDQKGAVGSVLEGADSATEEREAEQSNACILVWEGPISTPAFTEFGTFSARTQKDCRYHLRKHGVAHYWDLATQGNPAGNENLGMRRIG